MTGTILTIMAGAVTLLMYWFSPMNQARRERRRDKKNRKKTMGAIGRGDADSVADDIDELLP